MKSISTAADMRLAESLFSFIHPECLPLSFCYGDRIICGLPAEFSHAWKPGAPTQIRF